MLTTLVALTGGVGAALIAAWVTLQARRPRKSRVELVDVSLPLPDSAEASRDHTPVLDVKVRNTGGQSAVLKRLVVHTRRAARFGRIQLLLPYGDGSWIGASLYVSETYDVTLPAPEKATGARTTIGISQVIEPGGADRFLVRLGLDPTFNTTVAYLLHLEMLYDGDDRNVASPPLAVAFPQHGFIYSTDEIRDAIHRFQQEVSEVRRAIDKEMTARGLPAPDWIVSPPRRRRDLPDGLLSVDGIADPIIGSYADSGIYEVNENFWDPQRAVERHLRTIETMYRELIEVITPATVMHDFLRTTLLCALATLAQLPALHAEFCTPKKGIMARTPTPTANPDATDQPAQLLARLLAGQGNVEELRTRVDASDKRAIWFLDQLLAHPDLLEGWRAHNGANPNATRLAELLEDRLRAQGSDHPDTLLTRHKLAFWRWEAGDAAGAAAALVEVVEDLRRVLGTDHPDTLKSKHALGYWQEQASPDNQSDP